MVCFGTATNLAEKKAAASNSIQGAIAGVWAKLSAYFEDMDVEPIYFLNPLDIATYLANTPITVQTAFGFQYVENFLGLGTVVLDNSVEVGKVKGTVKQNLNAINLNYQSIVYTQYFFYSQCGSLR